MRPLMLIPQPQLVMHHGGVCPVSCSALDGIGAADALLAAARSLGPTLTGSITSCGLTVNFASCSERPDTPLLDPAAQARWEAEGYRLTIGKTVDITAPTAQGRRLALETLGQILVQSEGQLPQLTVLDWPDLTLRGAHVCWHLVSEFMPQLGPDLAGLKRHLRLLAHYKANAVLLELEAMFPFQQPDLAVNQAFSPAEIAEISAYCRELGLRIIPLLQCLGHAYFVLRHPRYAHLREDPRTTQQYCPSNPAVVPFYARLVDEVLQAFPDSSLFHIGGDESRRLGVCPTCAETVRTEGVGTLYGRHVGAAAAAVRDRGVQPLVWTDMVQKHAEALEYLPDGILFDYWNYTPLDHPLPWFRPEGVSPERIVASPGVRYGRHNHTMYRYTEAMQGISVMINQAKRLGYHGQLVTDWMKVVPWQFSAPALAYSCHLAWGPERSQAYVEQAFSQLHFGRADTKLLDGYRAMEDLLPFCEDGQQHLADRLDRYDLSGLSMAEQVRRHSIQDNKPQARRQLERSLAQVTPIEQEWSAFLASEPELTAANRHDGKLLAFALKVHGLKAQLGLAILKAVELLKYPLPEEERARSELAAELARLEENWDSYRSEGESLFAQENPPASALEAITFWFEPDARAYMTTLRTRLQAGKPLTRTPEWPERGM